MKRNVLFSYSVIFMLIFLVNLALLTSTRAQLCNLPESCGTQVDGDLCIIDEFENFFIVSSTGPNTGDIRLVTCQDAEYVSDGSNWISCLGGQYILKDIRAHDYFCNGTEQREEQVITDAFNITTGNGQESIIECCGSGLCNSDDNAGIRLTTGQSIIVDQDIPIITETCPPDEILVGIDSQDNIICEETTAITLLQITTNTLNYNISKEAGSPTNAVNLVILINSGVIVGSTDTSRPAFTTGNLPAGSTVEITNEGRIQGAGGKGANAACGDCFSGSSPQNGNKGGDALELLVDITLDNQNGEIWSGGGGGGDGGYALHTIVGGGGGGAGFNPGVKGNSISNAQPGTLTEGGAGGTAQNCVVGRTRGESPRGGAGGEPGEPGVQGDRSNRCGGGGVGGAAGKAIVGISKVTFIGSQGDIRGPTN